MPSFDPSSFLDATITEPTIKRPPIAAGTELIGTITDVVSREWVGKADPTKSGVAVDLKIEVDLFAYPDLLASVGVPKLFLQDGIMLDLTPAKTIDTAPGKNGKLRRYRDALGMNKAGEAFSFRMMTGRMIRVKLGHREDQGDICEEVAAVAKA